MSISLSLSLSLAQMVQNLAAVKNSQIGACKKVPLDTKLEMQNLISESAEATTSAKNAVVILGL